MYAISDLPRTMNTPVGGYQRQYAIYTERAKQYSTGMCHRAIADCHETLKIFDANNGPAEAAYITRLWAEIDAMRDRLAYLSRRA